MAGRIRVYFDGDASGTEAAAKKAEKAIDGVDGKTKSYNKSSDESVRSTDRSSDSLDRHAKSADSSSRSNDGLSRSLRDVNTRVTAVRNAITLLKWPALITGAGYAAEGLGEASAAAIGLVSALAPLGGLLIAYPGYLGAFAQGLGVGKLALFGVTDAVKEMSSVQESAGTTAKASGKAQESAAEGVRSAQENLNTTVRSAKDARTSLTLAEKEAVTNLKDLADAAVDASLSEERAALNLQSAKAALRKAEREPGKHTGGELSDLELSVKEAQQGLKESRRAKREADHENAKGEREGVKGDPKVLEAKRALSEANHQIVVSARALKSAQKSESESFESTGSAASGLQQKLASMPIAGQKFAKFLFGLDPKLKQLQSTAASGLLPGAEKGITKALTLFPRLNTAVGGTSKVLGNLVTRAGEMVGSKGFGRDFTTITKGNETLISRLGSSGLKWADALRQVLVAGQPLLDWISKSGLEFSTWIDNSAKAGRQTGSLGEFFDKTRTVAEKLISIVGNLGGAFLNIGKAAAPLGEEILDSFVRSSETLEKWTDSMKGKNELKAYFEDAKPGIFEMGRLIRDASEDLIELSTGTGFVTMTRAVRTELLPVLTEMVGKTTEAFGPALVEALVEVGNLLGNLAGTSGPLTLFVKQVTSMLKVINWGFKNIPGLKFFVVTLGGIATVAKALKFTGMVSGFSSSLGVLKKIATWLGFIQTKEEAIAATSIVSGGVGGAPVFAGAGRDLRTVEATGAGEFGEKKAVNEAFGLGKTGAEGAAGYTLGQRALNALPDVLSSGLGLAATGGLSVAGALLYNPGGGLLNPAQAGMSESEEKAHLNRADQRHERNVLKGAGFNLDTATSEKQFATLREQFKKTMAGLKSDAILGSGAINGALGTGLSQIDAIWEHGTAPWRKHSADAMRGAVAEIKQGMKAGTISTEEGQKEISELLSKIHLVRGDDPFGLAEATTKQFKEANAITASGVADWTRKLEVMPKVAREKSRGATEGMLEEWAKGHPKLEAQIQNLTDYEVRKFGATNKQIREGVKTGATGPVAEAFKEAAEGVGGALSNIKVNANEMLKALGWSSLIKFQTHGFGPEAKLTGAKSKETHNFQNRARGGYGMPGFLRGSGKRDTVPVMAAPGEAFLTQHQQPEVQIGLAVSKALGIGQNGSLGELFANRRKPHFMAKGGEVTGPQATATIAGAALNKVDAAMNNFLAKHPARGGAVGSGLVPTGKGIDSMDGHPVAAWIWKILEAARKAGVAFTISSGFRTDAEQTAIYESGVRPAAVPKSLGGPGSNHEGTVFPAGAVDISPGQEALNEWLIHSKWKNTLIYAGSKDPVHFSHPHDGGYALGGFIQEFAKGGFTSADIKSGGVLSPEEWMIAQLLGGFPPKPGVIAQGTGTIKSESAFNASSQVAGNEHEGGWALSNAFGPTSMKLNPIGSSHAAFLEWQKDGGFWQAWGQWEQEQGGLAGGGAHVYGPEYLPLAEQVVAQWLGGGRGGAGKKAGGGGGGASPKNAKPAIGPATSTGLTTALSGASVAELGGLKSGVITGSASWMPQQFKKQLLQPGLNFGQKVGIANEAVEFAEETGTSAVGGANFGLELEESNRTRIQNALKTVNKELKRPGSSQRRQTLLKKREHLLEQLGNAKTEIKGFKSALKGEPGEEGEGSEASEPPSRMTWANAELAEAELTPGTADDRAVQEKMLALAEEELEAAKASNDPEAIASAAQAVKQLTETLKATNELAEEQLTTSAELALAELTPDTADDEAAKKKLLEIAEAQLAQAISEGNKEAIIQDAHEVKSLREAIEASNEIALQKEGFEKEQLEVNKRLATIAEEQGPAFMGAFVAYLDGAIGGPLQTNARQAVPSVAASYNQ